MHDLPNWGVIASAGVTYPDFRVIENMQAGQPMFLASAIEDHDVIVSKKLKLDGLPKDRASFIAALAPAAWSQGLSCHLVASTDSKKKTPQKIAGADLQNYLEKKFSNRRFVLPSGTMTIAGAGAKDYYREVIPSVIAKTARKLAFAVIVDARNQNTAALDLTLLSLAAQYKKPQIVFIMGDQAEITQKYAPLLKIVTCAESTIAAEVKKSKTFSHITSARASDIFYPNYFSSLLPYLAFATHDGKIGIVSAIHAVEMTNVVQTQWKAASATPMGTTIPREQFGLEQQNIFFCHNPTFVGRVLATKDERNFSQYTKARIKNILLNYPRITKILKRVKSWA